MSTKLKVGDSVRCTNYPGDLTGQVVANLPKPTEYAQTLVIQTDKRHVYLSKESGEATTGGMEWKKIPKKVTLYFEIYFDKSINKLYSSSQKSEKEREKYMENLRRLDFTVVETFEREVELPEEQSE